VYSQTQLTPRSAKSKAKTQQLAAGQATNSGRQTATTIPEGVTVLCFEVIVEELQPPSEVEIIIKSKLPVSGQGSLPSIGEVLSRPISDVTEPGVEAMGNLQHLALLNVDAVCNRMHACS
jgi:hypothetical protein